LARGLEITVGAKPTSLYHGAMKNLYLAILIFCLTGCALPQLKMPDLKIPRVYKLTVQQGNVITQEMVDRLEPGMSRSQVEYVMGRPVLNDPFEDDEWVYLYSIEIPDFFTQVVKMVLTFEGNTLVTITGDYVPKGAETESDGTETDQAGEEIPSDADSTSPEENSTVANG
jgi:outer membrane protein assembly factor BamE